MRRNWKREFERWATRGWKIEVIESKAQAVTDAQVVIISYDLLDAHQAQFSELEWDLIVCDEAHYAKNKKTRRASALFGVSLAAAKNRLWKLHKAEFFSDSDDYTFASWDERMKMLDDALARNPDLKVELDGLRRNGMQARRTVFASGTPLPNRPVELWPILERIDPGGLGWSYKAYTDRYCAADTAGWCNDVSGASNLDELQIRLRSACLIRRLKSDVLAQLPAKTHQLVEIPATGKLAMLVKKELTIAAENKKTSIEQLTGSSPCFTELSKVRRELGIAKIPAIIDHIEATLNGCEKLVVMAHHLDVISALAKAFPGAAVITGKTAPADRQSAVDRFQNERECRLFIGSITAAGTGITLTAASTVIFAERDWVPGAMHQAEDRLHRIGQTGSVLVQHLVVDGSLEARMAQTVVAKTDVIADALDRNPVLMVPRKIWVPKNRTQVGADEMETPTENLLPAQQVAAIHGCLKLLAAADPDYAHELNERGFSARGSQIGHRLAQEQMLSDNEALRGLELIRKYTRQLPSELFAVATETKIASFGTIEIAAPTHSGEALLRAGNPKPSDSAESPEKVVSVDEHPRESTTPRKPSDEAPPAPVGPEAVDQSLKKQKRRKISSTAAGRTRKSLAALHAAGGKAILLRLTPSSVKALEQFMAGTGETDRTNAINRLIEASCRRPS